MVQVDDNDGMPVVDEAEQGRRAEFIGGLRQLADFYERRPRLPAPYLGIDASYFPGSLAELQALVRAVGAMTKNSFADDWLEMRRKFGNMASIRLRVEKNQTCERVLVRTETVPAEPEHTQVVPAKPERKVPVYEWKCPPSLLAAQEKPQPAATEGEPADAGASL